MNNKPFVETKYFAPVLIISLLLALTLLYVHSHRYLTILEDHVAQETGWQQQLIEEQKKLKMEIAMLKSRQRIEAIAKDRLQMDYPEKLRNNRLQDRKD